MSPKSTTESGMDFALEALQGQIKAYTDNVQTQIRDLKGDIGKVVQKFDDHAKEERDWQRKVDQQLGEALSYGPRIAKLETTVDQHDDFYNQTKGAYWAGKIMWLLVGALASTVVWLYGTYVKSAPPPKAAPPTPAVTQPK